MITNHDRSGWFGASDTSIIMGNWNTKTFCKWWAVKVGAIKNDYTNATMRAGTFWEHKISDALDRKGIKDRQVKIRRWRLRVNLDFETKTTVYEIKTYSGKFKTLKAYWQQCQVQMFVTGKHANLVYYHLNTEERENFFTRVDRSKIEFHPVEYDKNWIEAEYLPRLKYLSKCLKGKVFPTMEGYYEKSRE